MNFSESDVKRVLSNPYYCVNIHPSMAVEHPLIVPEEAWVKAGAQLIAEIGAEEYLKLLLDNLKGHNV